uniref:Uncharacterized protein n=1 Tax=Rhabditophanes sp. KR3021 TaxID=114890 RepID=A0AC35TFZ3_9BILA
MDFVAHEMMILHIQEHERKANEKRYQDKVYRRLDKSKEIDEAVEETLLERLAIRAKEKIRICGKKLNHLVHNHDPSSHEALIPDYAQTNHLKYKKHNNCFVHTKPSTSKNETTTKRMNPIVFDWGQF